MGKHTDKHHFKTEVIQLYGGMQHHALPVPDAIADALRANGHHRVLASFCGKTYKRALQGRKEAECVLILSRAMMKETGLGMGDGVAIDIWSDPEPDAIELPEAFAEVLDQDPEAAERFYGFTPGKQRSLVHCPGTGRKNSAPAAQQRPFVNHPASDPTSVKKLSPFLREGEHLLWAGRPVQGWRAAPSYWGYAAACIMLLYTSIQWTLDQWRADAHWMLPVVGTGFSMLALRIMMGDPVPNMVWRAFLHIGLTNQRLLVLSSGWPVRLQDWELETLPRPRAAMGRPREVALFWGVPKKGDVPQPLLLPWTSSLPEALDAGWEPEPEPDARKRLRGAAD
jgi:hypothetical protein